MLFDLFFHIKPTIQETWIKAFGYKKSTRKVFVSGVEGGGTNFSIYFF